MKKEFWVLMARETGDNKKLLNKAMRQIMISYDFITKFETEAIALKARDNGYGKPDDIAKKVTMTIEIE
jgi:hypothetical protein